MSIIATDPETGLRIQVDRVDDGAIVRCFECQDVILHIIIAVGDSRPNETLPIRSLTAARAHAEKSQACARKSS